MDTHIEHINKHLTNFNQFAENISKVVLPIVDTAIKMSKEEPVSAYSVFKQVKELAEKKKKRKKNVNVSVTTINTNKNRARKLACARVSGDAKAASKGKVVPDRNPRKYTNKKKTQTKINGGENVHTKNFKGSEIVNLVDQLYTGGKLTKADQEKKQQLEDYLVEQLEMDDAEAAANESSDSEGLEEDYAYFDSESYSDDNHHNESGRFSNDETYEEELELSSTKEGEKEADETYKINKKRRSTDMALIKTKFSTNTTNTLSEAKKFKKTEGAKPTSRKSLSPAEADINAAEKPSQNLYPLASATDSSKNPTTKADFIKVSTMSNVKLEPLSPASNIIKLNSIEEGKRAFKWLLNPVTVEDFFAKYWEHKACLIKRQQSNYFGHLISFEAIDQMLLKNHVEFTKNIDVTLYNNGARETLNPVGRALPPSVWDHYGKGCSIRLLNPQTFLSPLYTLCTTMQEYFQCLVGANAYLTPPNSQGFAPHYDDIEAFVLQVEGRKLWRLYKPRSTSEILPRYSSKNFTQQEIGKPVFEEVLEPGDILYFPRGTIHQAYTERGYHSLHITLSVYQKQSYGDLLEKMLPIMLQKAIASNVDLRKGLPLNAWQHAGLAYSGVFTKTRVDLKKKVTQLLHKCIRDMPLQDIIDAGMDQLAKKFQHEALPPEILPSEKLRTVFGSRSRTNERGECVCDYDIDERTNVRLLRANILRLVKEEEKIRIYYYLDNSKEYCEYERNFIEIEAMEAASIEVLLKSYPQYVGVSELPLKSHEHQINLVTALWERGLLMMEKPFR